MPCHAGDDRWSSISGSDELNMAQSQIERTWSGDSNECSTPRYAVIDRNYQDGPFTQPGPAGDQLAETTYCLNNSDRIVEFYLKFDREEPWYFTAGNDDQNNTVSARAIAAHEFGHAAGFYPHFGASDTSTCDVPLSDIHTMCPGSAWTDYDDSWRVFTLEPHDLHEFDERWG
jgi:hypothetical protein